MDFHTLQFYPGPRVAGVVLNRPPLNVINMEMIRELGAVWKEIKGLEAQVVVLSGAGDRGFSAGVEVADHAAANVKTMLPEFNDVIRHIYDAKCITVAAIHGHTLGGGAELALVCDLVIGADDTRIGFPEISAGCFAPAASALLPRAIGPHRAAELLFTGEPINADEACRIGLLNRVVPRAALNSSVDEFVRTLLEKSSAVMKWTKRALREGRDHPFAKALEKTQDLYLKRLIRTEDMNEGVQAFLEKRPPLWKNR